MNEKKRIVILGAGISGLSAAFFLKKEKAEYDCLILEKEDRVGGYMESKEEEEVVVEKGPHIFKRSRNEEFLQLVDEVGFSSELIFSSKKANQRYLWIDGKLQSVLRSVFIPLVRSLFLEWKKPILEKEETIAEFATRRFGEKIAKKLFDPITLGVYGGDSQCLSIDACFPIFKRLEKEKGSVTKGLLLSLWKKKTAKGLFSFKKGVESFIKHLEKKVDCPIFFSKKISAIKKIGEIFQVVCEEEVFEADEVIFATPSYETAALLYPLQEKVADLLLQIPYQSITSINVVLEKDVLKQPGFGYLIPSTEKENILGVLFDSNIFPDQDVIHHTKITLMVRGIEHTEKELLECVKRCLETHLGIKATPKKITVKKMAKAIPQYVLGHRQTIEKIQKNLPQGVHLIGNYLEGVSVNDAVKTAKAMVQSLTI